MKAEQTNARNILPRLPQGAGSNLKSYSPTQLHFLMRLSHLQRQRRDMVKTPDGNDWHMRLGNKALYSTYRDCEDLGVGEAARFLIPRRRPRPHARLSDEASSRGSGPPVAAPLRCARLPAATPRLM